MINFPTIPTVRPTDNNKVNAKKGIAATQTTQETPQTAAPVETPAVDRRQKRDRRQQHKKVLFERRSSDRRKQQVDTLA